MLTKKESITGAGNGIRNVGEALIVWIFSAEAMKVELLWEIIDDVMSSFLDQEKLKHHFVGKIVLRIFSFICDCSLVNKKVYKT